MIDVEPTNPEALRARFDAALAAARSGSGDLPSQFAARLSPQVAAALAAHPGPSPSLIEHYVARMPQAIVAQWEALPPLLERWLLGPLPSPRFEQALSRMATLLAEVELSFAAHVGAPDAATLLDRLPSIAAIYFHSFFGGSLPMLGLGAAERRRYERALDGGADAAQLFERHLLGNLIHELCHGGRRAAPSAPHFLFTEAAAIHLGAEIEPRHVFADEPGEAVPAAGGYYLLALGLERLLGRRALWALADGTPLEDVWPPALAAVVRDAERAASRQRPEEPFAGDASRRLDWLKLVDVARVDAGRAPRTLDEAAALPLDALPWSHASIAESDWRLVASSLDALFSKTTYDAQIATVPDELPDGEIRLDVARCVLQAAPRSDGVFGEPATGILPPSIAHSLAVRGLRQLRLRDATRALRPRALERLRALVESSRALPATLEISCS